MKVLSKYNEDKYIIIISDTSSNEKLENIKDLLIQAEKMNITIATIFLSKSKKIKKQFYNEFPKHLNQNNLFNISSEVNHKNPFAHYFIKKKTTVSQVKEKQDYYLKQILKKLLIQML